MLEENIAVLSRAHLNGMFGIERARFKCLDVVHVDERQNIFIIDAVDFGNFVAGAESVEEVQERHSRFKRRQMGDKSQVHRLLNRVGRQHGESRLAARHNVRVVSENVESVAGDASCANVEDAGQQFARDFVHIWNHQQQTLAGGIGSGKRACHKRAVHSARRARFGLHFRDAERLSEHVYSSLSSPFVGIFGHGRGGSNGVNSGDFAESVRYMRSGGITVDCHFLHREPP